MDEKIKLYEEMLSLDPASKLFLRLAELYFEKGAYGRALEVLKRGLEGHPEYLEARFCLLRVCQVLELEEQADQIIKEVVSLFEKNIDFWFYWSKFLQKKGQKDLALLVGLLGAALQDNRGLSLTDLVLKFLTSPSNFGLSLQGEIGIQAQGIPEQVKGNEGVDNFKLAEDDDENFEFSLEEEDDEPGMTDKSHALSGVRTRTMADILAEQGDLEQAREIYEELLARAVDGQEKQYLQKALEKIHIELEQGKDGELTGGLNKRKELQLKLERLAERLEARALGG